MGAAARVAARMAWELKNLERNPPVGASVWPVDGRLDLLEAAMEVARPTGPHDRPTDGTVRHPCVAPAEHVHAVPSLSDLPPPPYHHTPQGPKDTVYEGGTFKLSIHVPDG